MAILLILIVITLAMLYRYVRKTMLEQRTIRCRQVRELFIAFGVSNRVQVLSNGQIQAFWRNTADTSELFESPALENLRIDMYDNSVRLQLLKWTQNSEISAEIFQNSDHQYEHDLLMDWFDQSVSNMKALVNAEMQQRIPAKAVIAECVNLVRTSFKAGLSVNWRTR